MPENLTLRDIFDRNKIGALKNALKVEEMIRDIELDERFGELAERFGDVEATDDNRPMSALKLARQLCHQLLTLACLRLIIANENRR
jgi:hypothetical protein